MHMADRVKHIAPFHVMALLARARAMEADGRDIVHMEIGEPDFPTPEPIVRAGQQALAGGATHYTPALGLPELRRAISGHYRDCYGLKVPWQRIVVTPGGSGALLLATAVLVQSGDEVILPDPGYPCNRHFVRLFDGVPVNVALTAQTGFQFDLPALQRSWRDSAVALMLASPSNPTGTLIAPDVLGQLIEFVEARGARAIVDEIYHGLVYGADAVSALSFSDNTFVLNSFSKYFGMTGWRLGWMVVPEPYLDAVERVAQNIFLAPSTPAQYAALAAFSAQTREILEERRRIFAERRDFLVPALRDLGFDIPVTPSGAFYIYADCSKFTRDSFQFCEDILEKTGVVITPGADFSVADPKRYVRFAYTTDKQRLEEAVARLRAYGLS